MIYSGNYSLWSVWVILRELLLLIYSLSNF